MKKFYNEIPEMTFFKGDTLPIFTIKVNGEDIEKCSMRMVISRVKSPEEKTISIECVRQPDCFRAHLWSLDTQKLDEGTYRISFIMTDDKDPPLTYIKLSGLMHVRSLSGG